MAAIRLTDVQKSYGDHPPVIRRVNLEIAQHEFCVFLGPSGCGKSTLLRMIAGLEDLSEGELHIGERLMNDVPAAARGVAMVFQSYALFPHMTRVRQHGVRAEAREATQGRDRPQGARSRAHSATGQLA
ncbi:MAG TPA: ATP-binding cassette domain-containing protein [Paraburkholderia sp.]